MPPVWAVIDTANDASHRLFERHGFRLIPAAPGSHHDIRLRPRNLSLLRI
jgi:RimJ/RimL family protein N-acetyltransferase